MISLLKVIKYSKIEFLKFIGLIVLDKLIII